MHTHIDLHQATWHALPGPEVEALEAGRWWDAVQVRAHLGARILSALGDHTGAVIYDPSGQVLYWLTRAGGTDRWRPLPGIEPRSTATYISVPPPRRTEPPGVHWLIPATRDRYLTKPDRLYAALAAAVEGVPDPPTVAECIGCRNTTSRPVQVRDGHGGLDYACPYCAPQYQAGPGLRALTEAARPYHRR